MWWSERVQLQVLGGQLNIQNKTNPLLTPMGREMRGPLCVLAGVRRRPRTLKVPARSLPLAHSLTHSVHTISPPTLYPSLHWPLSRALVTPLALDSHRQGSLQPFLQLPAHPSSWPLSTVPFGQSPAPSPTPSTSSRMFPSLSGSNENTELLPHDSTSLAGVSWPPAWRWLRGSPCCFPTTSHPPFRTPGFKSNVTRTWHLLLTPVAAPWGSLHPQLCPCPQHHACHSAWQHFVYKEGPSSTTQVSGFPSHDLVSSTSQTLARVVRPETWPLLLCGSPP